MLLYKVPHPHPQTHTRAHTHRQNQLQGNSKSEGRLFIKSKTSHRSSPRQFKQNTQSAELVKEPVPRPLHLTTFWGAIRQLCGAQKVQPTSRVLSSMSLYCLMLELTFCGRSSGRLTSRATSSGLISSFSSSSCQHKRWASEQSSLVTHKQTYSRYTGAAECVLKWGGGTESECVSSRKLGGSGAMLPWKSVKFESLRWL